MGETNEAAKMWDCLCSGLLEQPGDAPPWTFARAKILLLFKRIVFRFPADVSAHRAWRSRADKSGLIPWPVCRHAARCNARAGGLRSERNKLAEPPHADSLPASGGILKCP